MVFTAMTDRHWHYVRENRASRIPRHHVFLDAEARRHREPKHETQDFRLAVGCFYAAPKGRKAKERWERFTSPVALWSAVSGFCDARHRTVVWAHNLGYDVRISAALETLPALGWRLVAHNMANRGTWLCWSRGDASLVMVDSSSVFPTTIAQVGKTLGIAKEELPSDVDSDDAWWERCETDVAILRASVLAYLRWLETEDLGNWQWTGAGQSWAAFRHRFMTHRLLVHDDTDALAAERRAMWTGRCEAYWHGSMLRQVLHEWDMETAYARIARDTPIPVRLVGPLPPGSNWRSLCQRRGTAVLADVTVRTDVPIVPTAHDGRILWPVGQFETTLWDVELRAALEAGAQITVHNGWVYRTAPALRAWGEWVIDALQSPDDTVPAIIKIVLKHWSRALIGRFAMSHATWQHFGSAPTVDTRMWTMLDLATNAETTMMQVGRDVWTDTGGVEWSESMPMVTGYVMAVCRVDLWRIVDALPEGAALYVDTDSIFATDAHFRDVAAVARSLAPLGLRCKRSWVGFTIEGPRQIVTGAQVRVAGLPTRAVRLDRRVFAGEVWESLTKAIKEGRGRQVRVTPRRWELRGTDRRRIGRGVGWTEPYRLPVPSKR
jgi:hypothetical protein